MKNLLLLLSSLIFAFALSVGADRLVGLLQPATAQGTGLIFPPNAEHDFRTREFAYKVKTNSLGFRDREFDLRRTVRTRIIALGDSFTFGWGVEANQAWPKVLEARLRAAGFDAEVANLGRPGASPRDYAAIAERAIPLLKPDLVIVGVLHADDLAQMAEPPLPDSASQFTGPDDTGTAYPRLRRAAVALFPHLLAMADKLLEPQLFYRWKEDAQRLLISMTPAARARFEKLDHGVREAFINGQLNPALINITTSRPDYLLSTLDLTSAATQHLILEMASQLTRIDNAARRSGAKTIVVSVPYGAYVSRNSFESRQRLGFEVVPKMLTTNAADQPIRQASEIAGLSFFDVTDGFRQASLQHDLFFELDGHFNAAGHERFAELLMPTIKSLNLAR